MGHKEYFHYLLHVLLLPLFVHTLKQETVKSLDAFQRDCLDAHNTYRSQHGVQPLVWSEELAQHAQNWADQLASRDEIKHDLVAINKNAEGENLAFFRPAVPKCQGSMVGNCVLCREMVKRWYDEIINYDYDTGHSKTPGKVTKHFSQIVWANTSEVGIGTAVSKKYGFITVARYRPQGNKGGPAMFVLNVPPEGGPLPSLSNDSPKGKPKPVPSTTPTGNGIPVTDSASNTPPKDIQQDSRSLDGSAIEKIQPKPLGPAINNEVKNGSPNKAPSILSMIVDLANNTKQENKNQAATDGKRANQNGPQNVNGNSAGESSHNGQEESSSLDGHVNKDFSYENADNMFSGKISNRDSVNGNDGRSVKISVQSVTTGIARTYNNHHHHHHNNNHDNVTGTKVNAPAKGHGTSDSSGSQQQRESDKVKSLKDEYITEKEGSEGRKQENIGLMDNKVMDNKDSVTKKQQTNRPTIHTDDGVYGAGSDIQEDLKNSGLVRTVKGPDGSPAQVYLTKNGAHAGLVFRDQISRVLPETRKEEEEEEEEESLEFVSKRVINVL